MNPKPPPLDEIADAILDGTPIDWRSVDTEDLPDKALVEQLKTLAALRGCGARVCRHRRNRGVGVICRSSSASDTARSATFIAPGIRAWIARSL